MERSLRLGLCREPCGCPWLAHLLLEFPAQRRDEDMWAAANTLWQGVVLVCCGLSPQLPPQVGLIQ